MLEKRESRKHHTPIVERVLGLMEDRGFVIRHHNLFDGTTYFTGQKGVVSRKKDYFTLGDTYTLSGAKKAVANLRRLQDDEFQYSIEMLEECYLWPYKEKTGDNRKEVCDSVEDAMKKLDELCTGNDFHRGDISRINSVRRILRELKKELLATLS